MSLSFPRLIGAAILALGLCGLVVAQPPADPGVTLDSAERTVADANKALAEPPDDASLDTLRGRVIDAQTQAEAIVAEREPRLASTQARLAELGPPPENGAHESAEVANRRAALNRESAALDGDIKRARLVAVSAQQLADRIADLRRKQFRDHLWERSHSPLAPAFWRDWARNGRRDLNRVLNLGQSLWHDTANAFKPGNLAITLAGALIAALLTILARPLSERLLVRVTTRRIPPGPLRRSALAFGVLLLSTAIPGLTVQALFLGLRSPGTLADASEAALHALVGVSYFAGFMIGLGRALLSLRQPSWRLAPLSDAAARKLAALPPVLATVSALSLLYEQLGSQIGMSLSSNVSLSAGFAVLHALTVFAVLRRIRAASRPATDPPSEPHISEAQDRPLWLRALLAAAGLAAVATLAGVLLGYVAFASFVGKQTLWVAAVVATLYLLMALIDDFFTTVIAARAAQSEDAPAAALGLSDRLLDQAGVLLSGVFRLAALLLALSAVLAPYGTDANAILGKMLGLSGGVHIGDVVLSPTLVLKLVAILIGGLLLVRELQRWFREQYLPRTQLDPGLGSSFSTLLGYVGGILVVAIALSALGLSVERIAWVASALSVGIGFGLQAIVQNFVSGLILLAERPVKVGDWVSLGDAEGDIRRINVRATEIQLGDRSTVIVPNSELITKTVRNVTWGTPLGRVLIKLPMPLDTDANALRSLILEVMQADPQVLDTPAPSVSLEGLDTGAMLFACVAYVASPRQAYAARSQLLFALIERMRAAGHELSRPATLLLREAPSSAADPSRIPGGS